PTSAVCTGLLSCIVPSLPSPYTPRAIVSEAGALFDAGGVDALSSSVPLALPRDAPENQVALGGSGARDEVPLARAASLTDNLRAGGPRPFTTHGRADSAGGTED